MTVAVRRELPADAAAVRRVVAAAFPARDRPEPIEAGLVDALRTDRAWIDSGWVAELAGEVIAQVLVVPVRVGGEPATALGVVSVLPRHQGNGYGTKVVWAAINAMIERGERLAVVVGSPVFYGRFGFVPAPVVGVESAKYPSPFLQALALRTAHPRGAVGYPPPYDDLDH